MPIRCLTLTGSPVSASAARHSPTRVGPAIRQAPNRPLRTRSEGQPTSRFSSTSPTRAPTSPAALSPAGSEPPSCSTTAPSPGPRANRRPAAPPPPAAARSPSGPGAAGSSRRLHALGLAEHDVLPLALLDDLEGGVAAAEVRHHVLHEVLGRAGGGRDAHRAHAAQPGLVDVGRR